MKRRVRLLCLIVMTTFLTLPLATPAHAEPVPPEQRMFVTGWSEGAQGGNTINFFGLHLSGAPGGTTITPTMRSCGRLVADGFGGLDQDDQGFVQFFLLGDLPGSSNLGNLPTQYPPDDDRTVRYVAPRLGLGDLVGRSYDYSLTVTEPGFDPYVLTGSHTVHQVKRPSCDTINTTVRRTIRVLSWSTLLGKPRVGRTVRATRPVTEGAASISFRWLVGRQVVSRRAKLHVRKGMRHQYVRLVVAIAQPGKTRQREYLAFPHRIK